MTSNYITNFETYLMPLDIGFDVIEPRMAYLANRVGRVSLIAYQAEYVYSEKTDKRARNKFNILIKATNIKSISDSPFYWDGMYSLISSCI